MTPPDLNYKFNKPIRFMRYIVGTYLLLDVTLGFRDI